jgi:hypothetical protein
MKKLLITSLLLFSFIVNAQKDKKLVEETISKNQIMSHIQFLASDAMKGRDTGSDELKIAAEYLRNQLFLYGVLPLSQYPDYLQPVKLEKVTAPNEGSITVDSSSFNINEDFVLLTGDNSEFDKEYIFLEYAMEDEIKAADVKGKIIITQCGDGSLASPQVFFTNGSKKRKWAKDAGAAGLVELYNTPQLPFNIVVRYLGGERVSLLDEESENESFVHIWMNNSGNENLSTVKNSSSKSVSIKIDGKKSEEFISYNVVGYLPGKSKKDEYIVYSAHYDHVGVGNPDSTGDNIYNGARDNAVGTVTVLSAAQNLSKYPTDRSALFVFFTGEEKGLLGSEYFVDNCPVDLNKLIYCFNSDGAGYNDTEKVTVIGLTRTTAQPLFEKACSTFGLTAIEDQMPEQGLFDRSDNVNFAAKGIPAPTFSMGVTAFDQEIMRYYHQPADSPESLDYDYLLKFFRSYVYSGRLIGNTKENPFWFEGDKYYEAGVKLYGRESIE